MKFVYPFKLREACTQPTTCPTCGVGAVRQGQGFFVVQTTCPTCGGTGQVIMILVRIAMYRR